MKKLTILSLAGLLLISCSTMPDGISKNALAPYSPTPHILMCNTTRALGTAAFTPNNNLLYYEMDNTEDKNASGYYRRESEETATVTIYGDDVYDILYKLHFISPVEGEVEEILTVNGQSHTHKGKFILRK